MPLGGDYTVTLTFTDAPRAAVEHTIDDICQNGDFPAESSEIVADNETESEEWNY